VAEAPPAAEGGSPLKAITRKVGPLPLWAYAAILVVGYFLYKRTKGGSTSSGTSGPAADTTQTAANTYVPGFDAAGAGGGGGIGSTATPGVVNNYYYGDQGSVQATGGGTSSGGDPSGVMTPGGGSTGGPIRAPGPISGPPTRPVDGAPGSPGGPPLGSPVHTQPFGPEPIPYRGRLGPAVAY
jgi:hypothetical protein